MRIAVPDIDAQTPQKVPAQTLTRLNPHSQGTVENLIDLVHLNPQSVLDVLRNRYDWELIYTAVGTMLIAVNPYRDIEYSTSKESADQYLSASLEQLDVMAPHIFAVATRARSNLIYRWRVQEDDVQQVLQQNLRACAVSPSIISCFH